QTSTQKGVENAFPVDIFGPPRISSYSVRPNLGAGGREFKSHRPDHVDGPFSCVGSLRLGIMREAAHAGVAQWRSEERRVGKECRSRWAPDRQKKKNARQECRTRTA